MLEDLESVQHLKPSVIKIAIPNPEVLAERNRAENKRTLMASATGVTYRGRDHSIELHMQSGVRVQIPRHVIEELNAVPVAVLRNELRLTVGGDAISVPSLDIDVAIPGLLRNIFGFDFQRIGGRAKTQAKAAASRENGKKGGRPRAVATRNSAQ